jgi:hypothetical protein
MFVDLGIIGVVLGLVIFVIVLLPVVLSPPPIRHDLILALLAATVASGMTNAFFEDWLYGFGNAPTFPFWLILGLIPIRLAQLRQEGRVSTANAWGEPVSNELNTLQAPAPL